MSPDFDELVGTELEPGERERLLRVHDLLVAAGPPPASVAAPIDLPRRRRRRGLVLALAAALAVAAFALGVAVAGSGGRSPTFTESMSGTAAAANATASLAVFDLDAAGNWPMKLTVDGLPRPTNGRPYELWLVRDGKLAALCGSFLTADDGTASVPLNAPYRFDDYDGWVVVREGSETPLLTT